MKPSACRYVVEERAMEALLFLSDEEQDFLVAYFRLLASRPHAEGAAWRLDDMERGESSMAMDAEGVYNSLRGLRRGA